MKTSTFDFGSRSGARPLGGRKYSTMHDWADYRARQCRVSGQFDRFEAVRILEKIGTRLPVNESGERWSLTLIEHLRLLVAYTRDEDWYQGRPIVWLSVSEAAKKLNLTRQQINRHENSLMRLGALAWTDSPNHKRYGCRDNDGNIHTKTCGINLMPLSGLLDDLRAAEREIAQSDNLFKELKAQLVDLRRKCRSLVAWFADQGWLDQIKGIAARVDQFIGGIRVDSKTPIDRLEAWISGLKAMMATLKAANPQFSAVQCPEMRPKGQADASLGLHECDPHIIQRDSSTHEENSIAAQNEHGASRPEEKRAARNQMKRRSGGVDHERQKGGSSSKILEKIDWKEFITYLDPSIQNALPPRFDEHDLFDIAEINRRKLGISKSAWGEACQSMTRLMAAAVVLMIATKHRQGKIDRAGGYLRELTRRNRDGNFKIWPMIYGLKS